MKRAFLISTAAALAATSVALAATVVKVGPSSNGKTVVLHAGDALLVSLPGNATTGYQWRVKALDQKVVKLVKSSYVAPKTGKVGSGGTYKLRFSAVGFGATKLVLGYVQAGSTKSAKKFMLTVVVKKLPSPA
jgi:inhibitor of cysteine peptidase